MLNCLKTNKALKKEIKRLESVSTTLAYQLDLAWHAYDCFKNTKSLIDESFLLKAANESLRNKNKALKSQCKKQYKQHIAYFHAYRNSLDELTRLRTQLMEIKSKVRNDLRTSLNAEFSYEEG